QQERVLELVAERDRSVAECSELRLRVAELERAEARGADGSRAAREAATSTAAMSATVALQTARREAAEAQTQAVQVELNALESRFEHLLQQANEVGRELAAAEAELRDRSQPSDREASALHAALAGRRLLYVGGRPSSNEAVRELVQRHGGEYQRHDGGIED